MSQTTYTFGDSDRAAQRLAELADLYAPSSRAFLAAVRARLGRAPEIAYDLGCGPGYTTRLLRAVTGARETIGLEASARFLALAEAQAGGEEGIRFLQHDVTRAPFPGRSADLVYVRFLFTHLEGRVNVLRGWMSALAPGGLLGLEELDTMVGSAPALERYYAIVAAMQRAHGQDMHVGKALPALAAEAGARVVHDEVSRFRLPGARMARLHYLNIQSWKGDAFVQANYDAAEIDALEGELKALSEREDAGVFVDYGMRQMVIAGQRER